MRNSFLSSGSKPLFHPSSGSSRSRAQCLPQSPHSAKMVDEVVTSFPKLLLFGDSLTQVRASFVSRYCICALNPSKHCGSASQIPNARQKIILRHCM